MRTGLLFIRVPEPKSSKNRLHLDLRPSGRRDDEVQRLLDIGATIADDHRRADGTGWAVLADPEGNELCVERSAAERGDPAPSDTGERQFPPFRTAGEREQLDGMLDWYRQGVIEKVQELAPHHASARPLRSATTISGLVKHLALVEDSWFHHRFAGNDEVEPWASAPWADDRDWEFTTGAREPIEDSVALYRAAIDRSKAAAAGRSLDDVAAIAQPRAVNLRFVLLHLIEETARHLGHLDVLRELLDGRTGE